MQRSDFAYDLPDDLIAQHPAPERRGSRLLCLDGVSGAIADRVFPDLLELVRPGDLLVFNDTRVIPARLFGTKSTGGRVEILIERFETRERALAHIRASKAPRPGGCLTVGVQDLQILGREGDLFRISLPGGDLMAVLEELGHMPLPGYIARDDTPVDATRYQTVYARRPGAVAAPTAGLHFDEPMLKELRARGVEFAWVTLHVGAGTFQPVRVERLEDHVMHAEWVEVDADVCRRVAVAKAAGRRVIAVGTTSVRSLETAAAGATLRPYSGDTRLFITPGFEFQVVDALLTNFHLPESTLLMLVSAFAGHQAVMTAYRHAVARRYRFFSYGDAMWLTRSPCCGADERA